LGGREVFLSYEDVNETLFGLLRLRINKGVQKPYVGEPLVGSRKLGGDKSLPYNYGLQASSNTDSALVRELHIFGPEVALGKRVEEAAQHHGLGERLLRDAERIAREEFKADRLSVLSGVGAREYYRSLGYALKGAYMVKDLD
jgi:elongator complex protein 3